MIVDIYEGLTYDISLTIGGFDASPYFVGWSFKESLGGKATATLELVDKDSNNLRVRPSRFGPNGGSQELHPHDLTKDTPVIFVATAAGMPSEYPAWLIEDVDHSGGTTKVELVDYHVLLEQDGYNGTDILAERGNYRTTQGVIEEMADEVDIEAVVGTTDFPINELRRSQTSRLAVAQKLILADQGYTQFRGEQMHVLKPDYTGGAQFDFNERNLTVLSHRETRSGHKNRFRASRLQPGTNRIVGQARGDKYGRNSQTTATIEPPSRVLQAYVKTREKCTLGDFVAFDAADNPVSTSSDGSFVSAFPIARVEFTAFPVSSAFDLDTVDMQFHVYFTGATGQPAGFDTEFSTTVNSTAEQGYYGVCEEFTVAEDAVWPTKAIAQMAAQNLATENADQRIIVNGASWLNPRLRAGIRVSITDWEFREAGSTWLVRDVAHQLTRTTNGMTFGCTRRRTS